MLWEHMHLLWPGGCQGKQSLPFQTYLVTKVFPLCLVVTRWDFSPVTLQMCHSNRMSCRHAHNTWAILSGVLTLGVKRKKRHAAFLQRSTSSLHLSSSAGVGGHCLCKLLCNSTLASPLVVPI